MAREIVSLKELELIIMGAILDVVSDSESNSYKYINEQIIQVTQEKVYDRYSPKSYKRRGANGGLLNSTTLEGTSLTYGESGATGSLDFHQFAKGNFSGKYYTDDLASTINDGWGAKDQPYNEPSKHIDYLNDLFDDYSLEGQKLVDEIIHDLEMRGFQVS